MDRNQPQQMARTILRDDRLLAVLQRQDNQPNETLKSLVAQWYELIEKEPAIENEVRALQARLAQIQERHLKILGGREVCEAMVLKELNRIDAAAKKDGPSGDGRKTPAPPGAGRGN